jgi:hypothetical protein
LNSRASVIALLRERRAELPDSLTWDASVRKITRWIFIDREGVDGLRLTWAGCCMLQSVLDHYRFTLERPRIIDIVRLGQRMRTPYYVAEDLLIVFDPAEAALLKLLAANLKVFIGFGTELC